MHYEEIPSLSKAEILAALERSDPEELTTVALSAALGVDDRLWAQSVCLRLATHPEPGVRGNAILGLGHLAGIHRRLDRELVEPAIVNSLSDHEAYVRGHADSAAEDVATFLGWHVRDTGNQSGNSAG